MKNRENMKKLNEEEVEKVAGGLPYIIPHHFPITQPSEPEEPAEPKPEPGPMGQQVSPEEEFNTIIDFLNSRR